MAASSAFFCFFISIMKTIHLTVQIRIKDEADPHEVAEDLDYSFTHKDILDTEIVNVCDENNVDIF